MKKINNISLLFAISIFAISIMNGCKASEKISSKSGAQIWGETCIRCHNTPSPETFSDVEWEVATRHMELRANLTPEEAQKVVEFLQAAN